MKNKKLFWIYIPFSILLLFSTVYIKAHYVVDVLAGLLSAPIVLSLNLFIYKKLNFHLTIQFSFLLLPHFFPQQVKVFSQHLSPHQDQDWILGFLHKSPFIEHAGFCGKATEISGVCDFGTIHPKITWRAGPRWKSTPFKLFKSISFSK